MRTEVVFMIIDQCRFFGGGDGDPDGSALRWRGFEKERASEQFGALAHTEQSEMSVALRLFDAVLREAAAVVADF